MKPGTIGRILVLGNSVLIGAAALAQPLAKPFEFDVASIKLSDSKAKESSVLSDTHEGLTIKNVPLRKIITFAYQIRDFQLLGDPAWVATERYDITARIAANDSPAEEEQLTDVQQQARNGRVRERLRPRCSRTDSVSSRAVNRKNKPYCC